MTTKERLIQELEHAPEDLLEIVLNFVLATKPQQPEAFNGSPAIVGNELPSNQPTGIASLLALAESFAAELTDEDLAQLPTDGALEHDHYIYGTPKRYGNDTGE